MASPDTSSGEAIECWVYGSPRQAEMYLYLAQQDRFEQLPQALLERFGRPRFVMQLTLVPTFRLAREDTDRVMRNLRGQGYHLQLPPKIGARLYQGD
ncbi:MAG: YcgL domain-containing protein [Gammaproteobacteria bacterium]|nr:YcgL domain-containing protein [Gammaproteobacteria bacterium]